LDTLLEEFAMTFPIKPPGGSPPPIAPDASDVDKAPSGLGQAKEAFREALDVTPGASVQSTQGSAALPPTEQVGADLAAGRTDRAGAIDALVAQSLATSEAALLTPQGRVELEAHLRAALADDPGLSGLLDDLERSA